MKEFFGFILIIVILGALEFGVRITILAVNKAISPMEENVKREVFEETKAYNEGKTQQLAKLRSEFMKAKGKNDKVAMKAIGSSVRHQFADYDREKLPSHLQSFINETERQ